MCHNENVIVNYEIDKANFKLIAFARVLPQRNVICGITSVGACRPLLIVLF